MYQQAERGGVEQCATHERAADLLHIKASDTRKRKRLCAVRKAPDMVSNQRRVLCMNYCAYLALINRPRYDFDISITCN